MNETIKSGVRKMLYTMITRYDDVESETESVLDQKRQWLHSILEIANGLIEDPEQLEKIHAEIAKIKKLEESTAIQSKTQYLTKIAFMTGVSVPTLWRIKKEGLINRGEWNTPGKKRPHKSTVSNLGDFDINAIRNKLTEFYVVKKQVPTLRTLLVELRESIGFLGCVETLRKILLNNGFEFKKNENERSVLIERFEIAAWRHRYLRNIELKRREQKPIIYLDETYVHQNYHNKKSWQGPSVSGVIEKISKGKRYIIVHAGSEQGFIPNAFLIFSTKSKLADYHHDMNSTNFMKWLEEKLIPNLPPNSVVVMDNASYHIKQINKPPSTNNKKSEIQDWLTHNQIQFEEFHTKDELLCLVKKNKSEPVHEAEELLKQHGHEVLCLPPYHCDLNPIEMIWSLGKRRVASKNIGVASEEMEIEIFENKYKTKDRILDTELEPFIINTCDDDDDSDDSFDDIEFLESDFNYDS